MSKLLTIAIPRYSETEKDVFPLLTSISGQLGVDFGEIEVLFCNDGGSKPLSDDLFGLFPELCVRQLFLEENGGPGMARQAGIDASSSQYIMFCDADDRLHNVGVLGSFFEEIDRDAPDIVASSWLEELPSPNGNGMIYIQHSNESTWMHGKVFRRSYLINNAITHHPKLRVHEDSYFLSIATAFTNRTCELPITSYVWCYREDSITRRNNASYTFDSIPIFVYACCEAMKVVEKRNPDIMPYKVCQFILYVFFSTHRSEWSEHSKEENDVEIALHDNLKPFWHWWDDAPSDYLDSLADSERQRNGSCLEHETIFEWLKRIRSDDLVSSFENSEKKHEF